MIYVMKNRNLFLLTSGLAFPLLGAYAQKTPKPNIGYEMFARFSPDGKSIAFTGQYDVNTEVYLIPTDGGEPQRLTYTATGRIIAFCSFYLGFDFRRKQS